MALLSIIFLFLIFLLIFLLFDVLVPRDEKKFKEEERRRKRKFDIEERWRQGARNYEELKEQRLEEKRREEEMFLEIPENAFGIYRGDQISQLSTNKVNLNFAKYEVSVPKPHSMLKKYYVDVWEDDEQLRKIYGISKKFNLENQDAQQLEITDLFLRLKKQLTTKYGPQEHDLEVTALLLTNEIQPKKFQNMDNFTYKNIYEKMEDKYTSLYGKNAFNPLMLRQITPSHSSFGASWNFSRGDIESIYIGCSRINVLTKKIMMIADKEFDDGALIITKFMKGYELTNEEKETHKKMTDFIKKETKLFGNICIHVNFSFRFNDYDAKRRIDKILRKDIFERNGNRDDWDAL